MSLLVRVSMVVSVHRGGHRHHHRRLKLYPGDKVPRPPATTGDHRPNRACPGRPGHSQGTWWVGMGWGGLWRAVGGARRKPSRLYGGTDLPPSLPLLAPSRWSADAQPRIKLSPVSDCSFCLALCLFPSGPAQLKNHIATCVMQSHTM